MNNTGGSNVIHDHHNPTEPYSHDGWQEVYSNGNHFLAVRKTANPSSSRPQAKRRRRYKAKEPSPPPSRASREQNTVHWLPGGGEWDAGEITSQLPEYHHIGTHIHWFPNCGTNPVERNLVGRFSQREGAPVAVSQGNGKKTSRKWNIKETGEVMEELEEQVEQEEEEDSETSCDHSRAFPGPRKARPVEKHFHPPEPSDRVNEMVDVLKRDKTGEAHELLACSLTFQHLEEKMKKQEKLLSLMGRATRQLEQSLEKANKDKWCSHCRDYTRQKKGEDDVSFFCTECKKFVLNVRGSLLRPQPPQPPQLHEKKLKERQKMISLMEKTTKQVEKSIQKMNRTEWCSHCKDYTQQLKKKGDIAFICGTCNEFVLNVNGSLLHPNQKNSPEKAESEIILGITPKSRPKKRRTPKLKDDPLEKPHRKHEEPEQSPAKTILDSQQEPVPQELIEKTENEGSVEDTTKSEFVSKNEEELIEEKAEEDELEDEDDVIVIEEGMDEVLCGSSPNTADTDMSDPHGEDVEDVEDVALIFQKNLDKYLTKSWSHSEEDRFPLGGNHGPGNVCMSSPTDLEDRTEPTKEPQLKAEKQKPRAKRGAETRYPAKKHSHQGSSRRGSRRKTSFKERARIAKEERKVVEALHAGNQNPNPPREMPNATKTKGKQGSETRIGKQIKRPLHQGVTWHGSRKKASFKERAKTEREQRKYRQSLHAMGLT